MHRKSGVMFLSAETLFLCSPDDPAIDKNRSGAVMIKCRYAKYVAHTDLLPKTNITGHIRLTADYFPNRWIEQLLLLFQPE